MKVLNLVISGIPSILWHCSVFCSCHYGVLNLVISGIPSIQYRLVEDRLNQDLF